MQRGRAIAVLLQQSQPAGPMGRLRTTWALALLSHGAAESLLCFSVQVHCASKAELIEAGGEVLP